MGLLPSGKTRRLTNFLRPSPPRNSPSMKKYLTVKKIALLGFSTLALLSAKSFAQTSSITLTSGSLAIPDGDLVQLIGDTSSSFGAPTATSFTGSDPNEVVLASFAMDDTTTEIGGVFQETITFNIGTGAGQIPAGSNLLLRWYPTVSFASYNALTSTPGAGTAYGQYTSTAQEYPGDPNPQTATPWTVPVAGDFNYDVWFLTVSEDANGPSTPVNPPANSAGLANLTVAAIPEPTTLSFVAGALALSALVWRRRRR